MKKIAIFAFRGDLLCFTHVMLNALEMNEKGIDIKIIFEGEAVKLVKTLEENNNPLYKKIKDNNLIDCICKACSSKMGVLEYNEKTGIKLCDELSGHPSMYSYIEKGYEILIF